METVKIVIRKPLYGSVCSIREEYIDKAIHMGLPLEIHLPHGSACVDPKWWKDTGERMEKIFLRPDEPMVLYKNTVPIQPPPMPKAFAEPKVDSKKNNNQLTLF